MHPALLLTDLQVEEPKKISETCLRISFSSLENHRNINEAKSVFVIDLAVIGLADTSQPETETTRIYVECRPRVGPIR